MLFEPYPDGHQTPRTFQPNALTCEQVQTHLDDYAQRRPQLGDDLFRQLHDHISMCVDCRHKLIELRTKKGLIPSIEDLQDNNPDSPPAVER